MRIQKNHRTGSRAVDLAGHKYGSLNLRCEVTTGLEVRIFRYRVLFLKKIKQTPS